MKLNNLFTDEDAVSPVIGVILMVAITVILAAVIGAFVLGIGSSQEKAPQASISFDYNSGSYVTPSHDGGETLDGSRLSAGGDVSCDMKTGSISAGDTLNTSGSACTYSSSGDVFRIVWTASSGDSTQIIGESTAP